MRWARAEEAVMDRVESVAGYGVLALAIALLVAYGLQLANPPADIQRAAESPRIAVLHSELVIPAR